MVDPDGNLRNVASEHADPAKAELARELRRRYPVEPGGSRGAAAVVTEGTSQLYHEITDDLLRDVTSTDEELDLYRRLGPHSAIVSPLRARGRILGALTLVSADGPRRFGEGDLAFVEEIAQLAGADDRQRPAARRRAGGTGGGRVGRPAHGAAPGTHGSPVRCGHAGRSRADHRRREPRRARRPGRVGRSRRRAPRLPADGGFERVPRGLRPEVPPDPAAVRPGRRRDGQTREAELGGVDRVDQGRHPELAEGGAATAGSRSPTYPSSQRTRPSGSWRCASTGRAPSAPRSAR